MPDIRPTSIRLTTETLRFVDERAKVQGCSRSFFIEDVLKKYAEWLKAAAKEKKK